MATSEQTIPLSRTLNTAVVQASIGIMLVFYSVTVVAYSLPFVSQALFTTTNHIQAALDTLGLVAAGYVAKPLAQAISGSYADRHGRKPVLIVASLLAAATALALAVLPTVSQIGVLAPVLFVAITAVQAGAAGSEWPLLAAYIGESTVPERRGFMTSFASFMVCLGWLIAIVVPLLLHLGLSEGQYAQWGWRVAFLPAVVLGLLSAWLRREMPSSPVYTAVKRSSGLSRFPLADLFRHQTGRWLAVMLHVGMISAAFFLTVSYSVVFVALADKFSPTESLTVGMVGLAVLVAGIMGGGLLADRFGPRPVSATGFAAIAILAYPAYGLMASGTIGLAFAGVILLALPLALSAGVYEAWIVSSFRTRYTGAATTCNGVGLALFGTPSIWLASHIAQGRGEVAPALLLVIAGVVGALSTRLLSPSIHEPLG